VSSVNQYRPLQATYSFTWRVVFFAVLFISVRRLRQVSSNRHQTSLTRTSQQYSSSSAVVRSHWALMLPDPCLCKSTRYAWPWPVQKQFSSIRGWCDCPNPGCRIVESHARCWLITDTDNQSSSQCEVFGSYVDGCCFCSNRVTGCKSSRWVDGCISAQWPNANSGDSQR